METIRNYLDNMFAGLPKTAQMNDLKNNILSNMEEKYNELKAQGKSENEAIGIVISEFGNIDELVNELGIRQDDVTDNRPVVTRDETNAYLAVKKFNGILIGIGVFLCILAAASVVLMSQLLDDKALGGISDATGDVLRIVPLFVLVAIAVGIFIYSGMTFEKYKYMEEGVRLSDSIRADIQRKYDDFNRTFYLSVIVGVCMLITSPLIVIIADTMGGNADIYGTTLLLCVVAVAVFIFIYFGSIRESYARLLQIGDYSPKKQEENRVVGAVASVVWPLAVLIFLFISFVYHLWYISWIIFPITGILFGMFAAAYNNIKGSSK